VEEIAIQANGVRFHALADGPQDGPLVLLLHGFPELSRSWRHQLPALAGAGLRAVAPDMRGYGRSGGREGPFDLGTLADDVAAMVRALGRERAAVVGHDWGGGAAWAAAALHPEVVDRLAVLNCPHPLALARALWRSPAQQLRSWYMLFFQLPWLPERLLSRRGGEAVGRALRGGSHVRAAFPWEETAPYRAAFADRAAAAAALGYYRAIPRGLSRLAGRKVEAPTLVIWGLEDRFLLPGLAAPERLAPFLAGGRPPQVRLVPGAGHFVQNEAPEEVNRALLDFLAKSPPGKARAVAGPGYHPGRW